MQQHTPSRTALFVALSRAAHQLLDDPKVLDDPLALRIVKDARQQIHNQSERHHSRYGRSLRAFLVARSRYAEQQLMAGFHNGIRQYIVLGAGLDTSAFRGGIPEDVRIFEVDHPSTQAWKLESLQAAKIPIPRSVQFVPVDFEVQNLETELASAGLHTDVPTFVSWLGVVPYLSREAAEQTLKFIGSFPAGSGIVFDYAISPSALSEADRLAFEALASRVASLGEHFRLFFTPEELDALLRELGFTYVAQLSPKEMNQRYFLDRQDTLEVRGAAARIVVAWT